MPPVTSDTASAVGEQAARRLAALDPLLAAPAVPAGCGAELTATGPHGSATAVGTCEHWAGEPGSLELTWGAVRRFQLTPQIAGPDVPAALDELLTRWRDHLAGVPEAAEEDTAVVLTWPTRDVDGPRTLLRHGLAPRAVIAARPAGRRAGDRAAGLRPGGLGIVLHRAGHRRGRADRPAVRRHDRCAPPPP